MKTSVKVVSCLLFFTLLVTLSCNSPQTTENESVAPANPLVGVWRLIEVSIPGESPTDITVSPTHPNLMIFTGKHFSFMNIMSADGTRPDLPREGATAAQIVAALTPVAAWSGTYEIEGNMATFRKIIDLDPNSMVQENFTTAELKFEGDTFSWTPKTTQDGPVDLEIMSKLVRVE